MIELSCQRASILIISLSKVIGNPLFTDKNVKKRNLVNSKRDGRKKNSKGKQAKAY
jgi:hypothetical protein